LIALNLVRRFKRTGDVLVHFDLYRHMADAEMLVQLMREPHQKFIAGMAAWHQAMTG
jgi:tRNA A37 threonylcarbamoyladenosine biosynthesis protein TsaE